MSVTCNFVQSRPANFRNYEKEECLQQRTVLYRWRIYSETAH